jgi:hypothetical protein
MMVQPILIGLVGHAGAGKDTVADHLCSEYQFARFSFAGRLKEIVSEVFSVPLNHFNDRELKNAAHPRLHKSTIEAYSRNELDGLIIPILSDLLGVSENEIVRQRLNNIASTIFSTILPDTGCSPRRAAQLIGTEGFREQIRTTVWTDYAIRKATDSVRDGQSAVISDVRFPDEMDAVRANGGLLWGIQRNAVESHNHASEQHIPDMLDKCDVLLVNNGTIDDVFRLVDRLLDDRHRCRTAHRS